LTNRFPAAGSLSGSRPEGGQKNKDMEHIKIEVNITGINTLDSEEIKKMVSEFVDNQIRLRSIITLDKIIALASIYTGIPIESILGRSNIGGIVMTRYLIYKMATRYTVTSHKDIQKKFNRKHSRVSNSLKVFDGNMSMNKGLREWAAEFESILITHLNKYEYKKSYRMSYRIGKFYLGFYSLRLAACNDRVSYVFCQ
jgi:hypothetical protein